MAAYIIVDIDVRNAAEYEDYKQQASRTIEKFGGEFLVRGGLATPLEGDWNPKRLVVLRFDSAERARAWWSSEEYAGPKALRQRTAYSRMVLVEGV